jgi:hypothetical protein
MKGVLAILATGICLSVAVATGADAAFFRTGVVANGFYLPAGVPMSVIVQGAGPADGSQVPTAIADTRRLHAAGHLILARADWLMPDPAWRAWIDDAGASWYVVGNEVPASDWDAFFQRFAHLALLIHAAGKEVVLPAAATDDESAFLRAVPARLWSQIDDVGVHPYALQDGTVGDVLENLRAARALVPDGIPLFVDEIGWGLPATLALYGQPKLVVRDEWAQAAKLTSIYTLLYQHRAELDLRQVDWFAYRDFPETAFAPWTGSWWQQAGLVRLNGSRRPSYAALAAIPPERR